MNKEEKSILQSHERGEWKPVKGMNAEILRYKQMAITRSFKETVQARALRDQEFREGLLLESIDVMLSGDIKTGKALMRIYLKSYINYKKKKAFIASYN